MSGLRTVLIVDDDPSILQALSDGLSGVLGLFDVATATNGLEAIQELERRSVDVLVTDLAMPVMDGFGLIAYVTNQRSALPVVVLSGMVGAVLDQRLAGISGLRVLRKPASYQDVATCVLEEIERVDRGQIQGIPLPGVLQLIEAERRSCHVAVRSGRRRGQLQFDSGQLINAFSDDFGAEGEAAAYDILGWPDTAIEFEPLPASVRRLIHTPLQLLLEELATAHDQDRGRDVDPSPAEEMTMADVTKANRGPGDVATDDDQAERLGDANGPTQADDHAPEAPDPTGPVASSETGDPPARTDADAPVAFTADDDANTVDVPERVDDSEGVDDSLLLVEPASDVASAPVARSELPPESPDAHVRDMLAAIERLAQRAKMADEALAAVTSEIDAFREVHQRFDAELAQRERQRRDLERFRDEIAGLAREILGRVDGLFDSMAGDPAPTDTGAQPPPT